MLAVVSMRRVVQKSVLTGLLSVAASLALSFSVVPLLGGRVEGAGLFMTIFCPRVISIPASALHFSQSEKVRRAEAATREALQRLADAYEALRLQSRTDGLTGVLTRTAFMDDLEVASQQGLSGALLYLDLDHFKAINDRYGHASGDEALRCAGRVLARYPLGAFHRWATSRGEFAVFQSGLTFDKMLGRCEELREEIAGIVLQAPSGLHLMISASKGACHCPKGFDPSECPKTADENLYQATALGRNRVVA